MADPQDRAEALDDDQLGAEFPADEPSAVDEYGLTGAEQRFPEPLDERVRRDEPERQPADDGPLVQPITQADEDVYDAEKDAVADAVVDPDPDELDTVGETATAAERVPAPAEEAAVRLEGEPGG